MTAGTTQRGMSGQRYWSLVAVFVVVLLTVQSVMGLAVDRFEETWGRAMLGLVAYSIVIIGAAGVLWAGAKLWSRSTLLERAWIGLALLIYAVGTINARWPQERLHYLGYATLAILLYVGFARDRATSAGNSTIAAALLALVVGSLVGFADELLQILWPRRSFDWTDVAMNVVAVGLGLLIAVPMWNALQREPEAPGA